MRIPMGVVRAHRETAASTGSSDVRDGGGSLDRQQRGEGGVQRGHEREAADLLREMMDREQGGKQG
jgi:hypothetical protein